MELLHRELERYPSSCDIQFTILAGELASYFSHIQPDPLLAELFAKGSLPAADYDFEANKFLRSFDERERDTRQLSKPKTDDAENDKITEQWEGEAR